MKRALPEPTTSAAPAKKSPTSNNTDGFTSDSIPSHHYHLGEDNYAVVSDFGNVSSACGEENRRIACSLNSLRMRRDCLQYASKTRRPKCLLPYKISPPELVFGKLPSFWSVPSLHRHFYHYACVWS
ncbi:hypothetical protein AVEN_13259-1 [Araneus ventricosus]|uniref:Uncharacterized protein n=1 Tax=Araneus ventricosus TaxID=182803 RepID=A0A4Y2DNF0_ARAVE|nr:hypothetical protein AVEN_13259-1 [Araneus ventricosus]